MRRHFTSLICILLLLGFVTAAPTVNFVSPTPGNNAYTGAANSTQLNFSITESSLGNITYNWNGDNFNMYNDSLVLMYNFDNVSALGENDSLAVDLGSGGNNGTAYNGTLMNLSGGRYGGTFEFDGVDDYMDLGDTLEISGKGLTVSAWVKGESGLNNYAMVISSDSGHSNGWAIRHFTGGDVQFFVSGNGNVAKCTNININDNSWHFITGVYNGTDVLIYCDTILTVGEAYSSAMTYSDGNLEASIGVHEDFSDRFWEGSIDEVRIWNSSFSSDEIYQEYVSNLKKYDSDSWELYINQSKNATDGLADGAYTYFLSVTNSSGTQTSSGTRTINIGLSSSEIPEWDEYLMFVILGIVVSGFYYMKRGDQ